MALTKKQIIEFLERNKTSLNASIIDTILSKFETGDNPDWSKATATATDILAGKKAFINGNTPIEGTCDFDCKKADLFELADGQTYAEASDVAVTGAGKVAFVYDSATGTITKVIGE